MSGRAALLAGSSPDVPTPDEVAALACHHDIVIAVDGGYDTLERAGVVPDVLIGDLDSISESGLGHARASVRVDEHPPEKDVSDLRLALVECERLHVTAVTLIGVSGGRVDHELASLGVIARYAHLCPVVRAPGHAITVLSPDGRPTATFSGTSQTLSVIALQGPSVVSMEGFAWDAARLNLDPLDDRGLSNIVKRPRARVTVHSGVVAVVTAPDARPE